ncbi:pimeloyl-ACP methyl ester carboxylesterase [Murinocardiopsis flavida]|uniref:Pimeloyl-ACP methyl ester carboxylesterase n=1 Tax=Murinocardiopsis flavida TaxID=645275 RepID=A0A2P8CSU7_9ACTN|nr:alpha/beta fold hydrolase [Murinocardiopsis flavida]PSK88043.1 pimeloyl-ACP methyl ester carboxylesterase [Murinocardiopsis flavida]
MSDWQLGETYRSTSGDVRWARFGEPDAPPVVLLHGTPFSSFIWRGIARALADRYRVHVWDMPGYGASEKSEGHDISLAAQARIFTELLDHWGLAEPQVVAHDSGGAVALGAHLVHGARYRRLALVDAVSLAPWGSPFFRLVGADAGTFARLPHALHGALVREYVDSASSPGLHPAVLDALVEPWLGDAGQAAFYRQIIGRLDDQDYTDAMQDRYGAIEVPVLVCWGADDTWIPVDRGRELAARIPGARFRAIPGAGHLVHEDAPAELGITLAHFLHASA